jgi:hypothetical protein
MWPILFLSKHGTIKDAYTYAHTLTSMITSEKLRRRSDLSGFEIDEVTKSASLLTEMSPPNEKYSAFMKHQNPGFEL